jgi:dipeptidyl aminopeptidase/acylaminoacyl peptidase
MNHRAITLAFVAAFSLACSSAPALVRAEAPPLIPRQTFFGEPDQDAPQISPDGHWLAWSKRGPDGVMNLWLRSLERDTSWQLTRETRGVRFGGWTHDGRYLLTVNDTGGDENRHVFAIDVATGRMRDLTPFVGARVEGIRLNPAHPREMLVGLNLRDPRVFDIHRIDLVTGAVTPDTENPGDVVDWTTDASFRVRACTALRAADVATVLRVRDAVDTPWREIAAWPFERAGSDRARKIIGFADDHTLIVQTWMEGNTSRLVTMDTRDGRVTSTLASDPRCDILSALGGDGLFEPALMLSPDRTRVQAVVFEYLKSEWKVLDASIKPDLDALSDVAGDALVFPVGRDASGRKWVVKILSDRDPGRFVLWDRDARRATPLFETRPELANLPLATMKPVTFKAADGLTVTGYLTLPPGVEARKLPLVLNVHGGPWARDSWGYNPEVQWLANRGYAVLQVNFRSSIGFGTAFLNAGDHEFGVGRVQGDLTDAVKWAVAQGIADPRRVGILGWSFGGYATLCGLAFTPALYACGVDGVGPSDLAHLIESFPPYWASRRQRWLNRFGDVVADSTLNRRLSPLYHVDRIRAPLLIGHGANDPRVQLSASERIVQALRDRGNSVDFVVYPNEGHGFSRSENRQDFYGRVERFLAQHLGGRAEDWRDVQGTTAIVR